MSSTSRPPVPAGPVAELDDPGAGLDQPAQDGPLGDDAGVVARVGGGGDAAIRVCRYGAPPIRADLAGVGECGGDGDRVGGLSSAVEVEDRVEDDRVVGPVEFLVDLVERRRLVEGRVLVVQHLGDRRGQSRLTVVDVANGADVDVRLGPLELGLRHWSPPLTGWSHAVGAGRALLI